MAKRHRLKRYRLRVYGQIISRFRLPALLLALLLFVLGAATWFRWIPWPQPPIHRWLLAAALFSGLTWLFSLLAPALAYVQPRRDRLRLQTPFYRLNISYRRIRNTRPVDITKAYPLGLTPRGFRRTVRQFYGTTALGIDLSSWPLPRWLLAFLLGRMILAPDQPGLILLTRDWMELSKQLETMMGEWSKDQKQHIWHPGANVGEILHGSDDDR
jgi:hypothetical protein